MRPPRHLERWAARVLAGAPDAEAALGDLAEGHAHHAARRGRGAATLWYARQILSLAVHRRRLSGARRRPGRRPDRFGLELRHALRGVRRRPGHALAVLGLLALAIGASTAAVAVTSGTLDAARAWRAPARTLYVWPAEPFSRGQLDVLRTEAAAFEAVGGVLRRPLLLDGPDRTVPATGVLLSPELFAALRAEPVLGRALVPEDAAPGAEPVVVLGHALWQRAFGGDPAVLDATVMMGGVPRRVVGVMPRGAEQPGPGTEVWLPLVLDPRDPDFWPARELAVMALTRPGVDAAAATADVRRVLGDLARRFAFFFAPDWGSDATVVVASERTWSRVGTPLLLLLAGSVLLLLVAAIDVGHLVLARSLDRADELRVRASVGATRGHLVGQMALEAGVLALPAALAGWALGAAATPWLGGFFPAAAGVAGAGPFHGPVLLFAAASGALAWLLVWGIPAGHFLGSTRTSVAPRRSRFRAAHGLVVAQAALSTALLVLAALLLRTVSGLGSVPLGFDPADVAVVPVGPAPLDVSAAELDARRTAVRAALASGLGAEAVGWLSTVPFLDAPIRNPAHTDTDDLQVADAPRAVQVVAGPDALEAVGVRVVEGRPFAAADDGRAARVALVNRSLAETLWGDASPVGRRMAVDPHAWTSWVEVVGVVEDVRVAELTSPPPLTYYLPAAQSWTPVMALVVRGGGEAPAVAATVRRALAASAPGMAAGSGIEMVALVRDAQGEARVLSALLAALAVLATLLGAAGLHGALATWVARRRGELGTRMALGASPGRLVGSVLGTAVGLTAVGVALGSLGAVLAGRAVRGLLFGVSPLDALAFLLPAVLLLATAALAALVPALRAGRVAPARVLREG